MQDLLTHRKRSTLVTINMADLTNCPTCGAKISSIVANCEYCGAELSKSAEGKLSSQEIIEALNRRIANCRGILERDEQKAAAISAFVLPSDLQTLAEVFLYFHGNVRTGSNAWGDPVCDAWKGKAKSAYERLRLASLNNSQMTQFIAPFDVLYGTSAKKPSLIARFFGA